MRPPTPKPAPPTKPFIHAVPDSMRPQSFRVRLGRWWLKPAPAEPKLVDGDWVTGRSAVTPGLILCEAAIHFAIVFVVCMLLLWARQ